MEAESTSAALALSTDSVPTSVAVSRPVGTVACLALSDILSILIALVLGSILRNHVMHDVGIPIWGTIIPALILNLCSCTAAGLYPGVTINPVEELRLSTLAITLAFLALCAGTFFLHDLVPSRLAYCFAYLVAFVLTPCLRLYTRRTLAHQPWWGFPVAILGYGQTGKLLLNKLNKNPAIGLKPCAVLDDDPGKLAGIEDRLIRGPLSRCLEVSARYRVSYGVVCMPSLSREQLLSLIDNYGQCFTHLLVIPNLIGMSSLGISAKELEGIVGLEVRQQLLRPVSKVLKRALDVAIALAMSPFALLAIVIAAILIKLEDSGPVFHANVRIGHGGKKFNAWKLRSMVLNGDELLKKHLEENPIEEAHWHAAQKLKRDPRITRVGRFIRKTSIDELPQFWNVLIGEMSVVGPRPILEHQVVLYGPSFSLYKQVRPGITGMWQISGRNHLSFHERVNLDRYVIQNWSVWLDIYILARTMSAVIGADGAY